MQFTIEEEKNNGINFLDIKIKKHNSHVTFYIYRNPTATEIIIPYESCHPIEQKLSAIRYLQNRNEAYITDMHSKQKEKRVIDHILRSNYYDSVTIGT
jgi:hypothetical protein